MPKFMTYQRPRPVQQPRPAGGGKPPLGGPEPAGRKHPKPAPDKAGPMPLPPLQDLLRKPK